MKTEARKIVDQMFEAFNNADLEKIVATFSDDAICIYHGTQIMPAAHFVGREGARMFFDFNLNNLKKVFFNTNQFVEQGDVIVVLGNEHFITNSDGTDLKNTWVQIYTVKNGLISKMEEFATSAEPDQYGGNANA